MKKGIVKLILTVSLGITVFTSCQKEQGCTDKTATNYSIAAEENDGSCTYPVKGCTDASSTNYNPLATESDGSCTYQGRYVVWTNQVGAGESANVYIDGVLQGNVSVSFPTAPACGDTGALTITKNLGSNTEQSFLLTLDFIDNGTVTPNAYSATVTFKANTCTSFEI